MNIYKLGNHYSIMNIIRLFANFHQYKRYFTDFIFVNDIMRKMIYFLINNEKLYNYKIESFGTKYIPYKHFIFLRPI